MFFLCSCLFICIIYYWIIDALDWQQVEKIRDSDKSDIYSIFIVIQIITFVFMIKQKISNPLLYTKEIIEIAAVILLFVAHVSGAIKTVIGLYVEAFICIGFFLVNFSAIFTYFHKRNTSLK